MSWGDVLAAVGGGTAGLDSAQRFYTQQDNKVEIEQLRGELRMMIAELNNGRARDVATIAGRSRETVAGTNAGARVEAANIGADAAINVAGIGANSRENVADTQATTATNVAGINANSRENVADIGAGASRYGTDVRAGVATRGQNMLDSRARDIANDNLDRAWADLGLDAEMFNAAESGRNTRAGAAEAGRDRRAVLTNPFAGFAAPGAPAAPPADIPLPAQPPPVPKPTAPVRPRSSLATPGAGPNPKAALMSRMSALAAQIRAMPATDRKRQQLVDELTALRRQADAVR